MLFRSIEYDSRGIRAIHDKVLNCIVAGNGSMDLWAEDDVGSLWERLKSFGQRINLAERAEMTVEAHTGPYSRLTIRGKLLEPIIWQLPPDWRKEIYLGSGRKMRDLTAAEALVCINSLDWTHEIYLHPASDRLDIRTSLNCDSENVRLHVPFDLGFGTCEDRAWYEIPYGMIERPSYRPMDGTHNNPDGVWPAVHWLAAVNEAKGYTCALLNRGIPAHRFIRGTMELHLHRSGRIGLWRAQTLQQNRTMNPLAKDGEMQVYEYAFVSGKGDVAANRLVHQGYEFNSVFPAIVARVRGGLSASVAGPGNSVLPSSHSFLSNSADNVIIPVIKRSEGDEGLVLRLTEVYGTAAIDTLSGIVAAVALTGPMEEAAGDAATEISFRPFEIITVRSKEA